MKRWIAGITLLACLLTSGCSLTNQPEHQAYVISMGLDLEDDGQLTLTVQIPNIGSESAGSSEGSDSDSGNQPSSYAVFSTTAHGFTSALDLMQATLPSELKLFQLKSLIVSEKFARDPLFHKVVDEIIMTYGTYGLAIVVVSLNRAQAFIEAQKAIIGIRLSTSVVAELEHYFQHGYMPLMSLSGLYAANHSIYSDPIVSLAATSEPGVTESLPANDMGDALPGALPRKGSNRNEYLGCALLRDGVMVGMLKGEASQLLELMRHDASTLNYQCDGKPVRLILQNTPAFDVKLHEDRADIRFSMTLRVYPALEAPDLDDLTRQFEGDITALLDECQRVGVEPFNLSEQIAGEFLTIDALRDYDFRTKFCEADIDLDVTLELVHF